MSEIIKLKGTYDTPAIHFNPDEGVFSISGRSLPASAFDFYSPILNAVIKYLENPQASSKFEFKMDFVSSSSTKVFQELFHQLEQVHQKGSKVQVNWYYKFGDDDMKELGDDLRQDSNLPFEFITYE